MAARAELPRDRTTDGDRARLAPIIDREQQPYAQGVPQPMQELDRGVRPTPLETSDGGLRGAHSLCERCLRQAALLAEVVDELSQIEPESSPRHVFLELRILRSTLCPDVAPSTAPSHRDPLPRAPRGSDVERGAPARSLDFRFESQAEPLRHSSDAIAYPLYHPREWDMAVDNCSGRPGRDVGLRPHVNGWHAPHRTSPVGS